MQSEKVIKPPLTRADSVGVNSRAPRRISTLFWSFMFFSFHHLGPVEAGPKLFSRILPRPPSLKKWWRRKGATAVQQWGPHSPIWASPSLLGQVVEGTVHKVVVPIPPPTRAISSALNERAPLRISTLFWLSILFLPFIFGRRTAQAPKARPHPKDHLHPCH